MRLASWSSSAHHRLSPTPSGTATKLRSSTPTKPPNHGLATPGDGLDPRDAEQMDDRRSRVPPVSHQPGQGTSRQAGGRLILICGLPGSGKTTLALRLACEPASIRMSADAWMTALDINLWEADVRSRVEALQWSVAKDLLVAGMTVIIEWGTWARTERDQLRSEARALGAAVELRFLDASDEELWRRIHARDAEDPPITRGDIAAWRTHLDRPTDAELALFDPAVS